MDNPKGQFLSTGGQVSFGSLDENDAGKQFGQEVGTKGLMWQAHGWGWRGG
jgi:hypothetical protein